MRPPHKEVWIALIGEELVCIREPENATDRYTIAVTKNEEIVRHLYRESSRSYFRSSIEGEAP